MRAVVRGCLWCSRDGLRRAAPCSSGSAHASRRGGAGSSHRLSNRPVNSSGAMPIGQRFEPHGVDLPSQSCPSGCPCRAGGARSRGSAGRIGACERRAGRPRVSRAAVLRGGARCGMRSKAEKVCEGRIRPRHRARPRAASRAGASTGSREPRPNRRAAGVSTTASQNGGSLRRKTASAPGRSGAGRETMEERPERLVREAFVKAASHVRRKINRDETLLLGPAREQIPTFCVLNSGTVSRPADPQPFGLSQNRPHRRGESARALLHPPSVSGPPQRIRQAVRDDDDTMIMCFTQNINPSKYKSFYQLFGRRVGSGAHDPARA